MGCPLCHSEESSLVGERLGWTTVRCSACGVRYLAPMPSDEQLFAVYDEYGVNRKNIKNGPRKVRRFKRKLRPLLWLTSGRRYLDIGCNTGFSVEAARQLGCEGHGIDLSREAIGIARELYPDCRFENQALEAFAMGEKPFDLILCSEVIEHLRDPHPFMEVLSQLLNQGGIFYFTTPDADHFRVPSDFMAWDGVSPPQHTVLYGKQQIRRLFREHGLEVGFFFPMLKANIRGVARKAGSR